MARYVVHLNYEDCIRICGYDDDGYMIHDERISDEEEQQTTMKEFAELVAHDEAEAWLKNLAYLYSNFEIKSMEVKL